MACDTFIKIALKCRRHFVTPQTGELVPFIEEILSTISSIICDLQTQQVKIIKNIINDIIYYIYIYEKICNIFITFYIIYIIFI